jgi:hypothetical protein
MNESSPTESAPALPGQRAATILGVALLAALGLTLIFVLRDNAHRTDLEVVVESSAVGDTRYLSIPEPPPAEPYPVVAHFQGQSLIPTGYKRHEKREADMQPLGKDKATGLTIYQAPMKAKDAGEPPTYFVKIGPGEFLKVRPAGKD